MPEVCMVFFRAGAGDLDTAARSLRSCGLTVTRQADQLAVDRPGSPRFRVRLADGSHVGIEAAEIGEGTPHAEAMRACSARFEIVIDDLDAALDEINTLMEVQAALQDAIRGFMFLPWNGNLSEPWTG